MIGDQKIKRPCIGQTIECSTFEVAVRKVTSISTAKSSGPSSALYYGVLFRIFL